MSNLNLIVGGESPSLISRQQIDESARRINNLAAEWFTIDKKERELNSLWDQYRTQPPWSRFESHAGENLVTAFLLTMLPVFSFLLDLIILSPITEFLVHWLAGETFRLSPAGLLLVRVLVSAAYVSVGYSIGAFFDLKQISEKPLVSAAALLYLLPMPLLILGYARNDPALHGPVAFGLSGIAFLNALVPIVFGQLSADSRNYLVYYFFQRPMRRIEQIRDLKRQIGRAIISEFYNLTMRTREHERRFQERVQPILTDDARYLIERYSNHRVALQQPAPAASASQVVEGSPPAEGESRSERHLSPRFLHQVSNSLRFCSASASVGA